MPPSMDSASGELESVLRRFARLVRSVGIRHGLNEGDVDEVVQDVRIRLWRARDNGTLGGVRSSYVYQAARSATVDLLRRRRAGPEVPLTADLPWQQPDSVTPAPGPQRLLEEAELAALVMRAVGDLIESRRVPVRMHLLGYEPREIAARLGWTGAKTRNLLSRGLADLRERLTALGIGPEGLA